MKCSKGRNKLVSLQCPTSAKEKPTSNPVVAPTEANNYKTTNRVDHVKAVEVCAAGNYSDDCPKDNDEHDEMGSDELLAISQYEADMNKKAIEKVGDWLKRKVSKSPLQVKDVADFDQRVAKECRKRPNGILQAITKLDSIIQRPTPVERQPVSVSNPCPGLTNNLEGREQTPARCSSAASDNQLKFQDCTHKLRQVFQTNEMEQRPNFGHVDQFNVDSNNVTNTTAAVNNNDGENINIVQTRASAGNVAEIILDAEIGKLDGDATTDDFETAKGSFSNSSNSKSTSPCSPTADVCVRISSTSQSRVVPNLFPAFVGSENTTNENKNSITKNNSICLSQSELERKNESNASVHVQCKLEETNAASVDEVIERFEKSVAAFWALVREGL